MSSTWPLAAVASVAIVSVIANAFRMSRARRLRRRDLPTGRTSRDDDRLDRFEQAVDAIALEVERIGEGQRFVTKILAERGQPSQAAPVKKPGSE